MYLAIGARPCSGAIMILMFSNALGIVTGNDRGNDHVAGNRAVDYGAIAGRALRLGAHGRSSVWRRYPLKWLGSGRSRLLVGLF